MKSISDLIYSAVDSYQIDKEQLGFYRIMYSLFILLTGAIPNLQLEQLSLYPDSFFTPPIGFAMFFDGFPSEVFCHILYITTIVLAVMMLFGVYTKWASLLFSLLVMLGYSFLFSLGKINHNTGFFFLPAFMAFSGWGNAYSFDTQRNSMKIKEKLSTSKGSFWIFMYAFTLGWLFWTASLPKIIGGWLNPSTHAVLGWFMNSYYGDDAQRFLAPMFTKTLNQWYSGVFWELADWFTIFFEFLFLWAVFKRTRMILFCAFACVFHWLVLNVLNIPSAGFLLCYVLFIDWTHFKIPSWVNKLLSNFDTLTKNATRTLVTVVITVGIIYLVQSIAPPLDLLFLPFVPRDETMYLEAIILESIGLLIALRYIYLRVLDRVRNLV
jgi:hypothetical protein